MIVRHSPSATRRRLPIAFGSAAPEFLRERVVNDRDRRGVLIVALSNSRPAGHSDPQRAGSSRGR